VEVIADAAGGEELNTEAEDAAAKKKDEVK